jgi:MarR family transcriptional regulator, temperature-dependent positive regulator of motility
MPKSTSKDRPLDEQITPNQDVVVPFVPPSTPAMAAYDLNTSPSHLLHRAQQVAGDLHLDEFGATGLTPRQVAVLSVLGTRDGISQSELVAQTGIDRSTLAEMVARMEARGLMVRTKSPTDSRANAVDLTAEGKAALADALPKLAQIDAGVLAFLPAGRREILIDLLTRICFPKAERAAPKNGKGNDAVKAKKKEKKKKDRKKKKPAKSKGS